MKITGNVAWLFKKRFLFKASIGALITIAAVYFFTAPFIFKPIYGSEVIVYAPLVILSYQLNQQGIGFGDEKEIDWYIQLLKSSQLIDSLSNRFDLFRRLRIERDSPQAKSLLYKKLKSRIRIEKTRYGSVSVKVFDHDPEIAAEIANTIIPLGEKIKTNILYPNRIEALNYARGLYDEKKSELDNIRRQMDSLASLSERNLQVERMKNLYNLEFPELISRKEIYERKKKEFDTPLPKAYIISSAIPAPDPVKPDRKLLIVIGAGLYLFLLVVIELIRHEIPFEKQND